jgi:SAM-dependent methyltransferase
MVKRVVESNRFEDFFKEDTYHLLKNYLYNYILRQEAVNKALEMESVDRVLEVGSGISPMLTSMNRVVYSDLSLTAMQRLKNTHGNGWYVVADSTRLPFRRGVFSHAICSEVLEHIEDDTAAIREMSRVLDPSGVLVLTFPHGKYYFAIDDRLVNHHRRYDLEEIHKKLNAGGFTPTITWKILGPLEKITMMAVAGCYILTRELGKAWPGADTRRSAAAGKLTNFMVILFKWANRGYATLVGLDAKVMPRCLSAVLLMKCTLRGRSRNEA